MGAGGRGCHGGHEAAGAKVLHGVCEPHARLRALGEAGAQRFLGRLLMAGRQRRWRSCDGRGGSKNEDAVVCGYMP